MPERLLFLDIDGVLRTWPVVCPTFTNRYGYKVMSHKPQAVAALNWLLRTTQAKLVITSTWREQGKKGMQQDLDAWGVEAQISSMLRRDIRGAMPGSHEWFMNDRSCQIAEWLLQHALRHDATGRRVVILDDDPIEICGEGLFLQTTIEEGLTWAIAEQARAYLQGERHA